MQKKIRKNINSRVFSKEKENTELKTVKFIFRWILPVAIMICYLTIPTFAAESTELIETSKNEVNITQTLFYELVGIVCAISITIAATIVVITGRVKKK